MTAPTGERRLGVDPRLRARRQDVLRQQGRRRLRRVQSAAAVIVAAGVGWAVAASPLLDVDRVIVRGLDQGRIEDVEAAAGIELGSPLVTVDLERVRSGVESVDWVATADVARSWPGSVLISVTERRPLAVALLPDGSGVLVDADRQLALTLDGATGGGGLGDLHRVVGAVVEARPGAPLDKDASGAVDLAGLLDHDVILGAVPDTGATEILVDGQGSLDLVLSSAEGEEAARVRFGPPVDLDDKVRTLSALFRSESLAGVAAPRSGTTEAIPELNGVVIDLRVASAPVVTREDVSEAP